MGLPLFVAPDESPQTAKATVKNEDTSPTRSAMRRSVMSESRSARRRGIRTANGLVPAISPLPWIEERERRTLDQRNSPSNDDSSHLRASVPPNTSPAALAAFFRRVSSQDPRAPDHSGADATAPRLLRLRSAISQRATNNARNEERIRSARVPRPRPPQQRPARFDRSPDRWLYQLDANHPPPNRVGAVFDNFHGQPHGTSSLRDSQQLSRANQNLAAARGSPGLDGLGDRDRSPPEPNASGPDGDCDDVWDEFMTMVSPDPQPPSANSSFAPAIASQRLASSTAGMPRSAPSFTDETLADVQCDSACEHSDNELPDEGEEQYASRRITSRDRQHHDASRQPDSTFARVVRRPPTPMDRHLVSQHSHDATAAPSTRIDDTEPYGPAPRSAFLHRFLNRSSDTTTQTRRGSPAESRHSGNESAYQSQDLNIFTVSEASAGTLGEEDWPGMQRIVRSLARREDIPDEWWAEAGLSRILPHGELPSQ